MFVLQPFIFAELNPSVVKSLSWLLLCCWAALPSLGLSGAQLDSDDSVVFFPALGKKIHTNQWEIDFHFWIYESEKRPLTLSLFRKILGFDDDNMSPNETALFQERARRFLADNERDKEIRIVLAGKEMTLGKTEANGHCRQKLPAHFEFSQSGQITNNPGSLRVAFHSISDPDHTNQHTGYCLLLEQKGISVVSDIDDTIKHSDVLHRKELLRNTFLKPYAPIPGMATVYQAWASNSLASFHYVTGSPWQLFEPLADFLTTNHFPEGSFHMRDFRWKDETVLNLLGSPISHKISSIEELLGIYPERLFVMVGDSGEKDPEIYGELARRHPAQVVAVYIRNLSPETDDAERFNQAFKDCPRNLWRIFDDPTSLPKSIPSKNK